MKKKFTLTLLALVGLSLASCGNNTATSLSNSASQITTTAKTTTSKATTDTPTTQKVTSGKDTGVSPTTTSSAPVESEWPSKVSTVMVEYLGGQVVPYVNLGPDSKLICDFYNGITKAATYVEVSGSSYDKTKLPEFQTKLTTEGYTVTLKSNKTVLTAVNEAKHLTINIAPDDEANLADSNFKMTITYDEPFDADTQITDWTTDQANDLASYLDGHSIPYVYLGSAHPYIYHTSSIDARVYGWNYDDSIIAAAKAAFEATEGWKVTSTATTFSATKTEEDECVLTVTISSSTSTTKAYMNIDLEEGYLPESVTAWEQDVLDAMHLNMNDHDIPFIYLGTKTPTFKWTGTYNNFNIYGSVFRAQMLTDAKTNLSDAGWTVTDWTSSYGPAIHAIKTFSDGDAIEISMASGSSATSKAYIYGTYIPAYDIPTNPEEAKWDDATLPVLQTAFGADNTLPYIYLGSDSIAVKSYSTQRRLYITPTASIYWNENIIINAAKVLEADGYTVTKTYRSSYGTYYFSAEKTFTNGTRVVINLNNTSTGTTVPSSAFTIKTKITPYLHIQLFDAFDDTYDTEGSWANSFDVSSTTGGTFSGNTTLEMMNTKFESHTIPYIYLGAKSTTSYYTSANNTITVYGAGWDSRILDNAKAVIAGDVDANVGSWSVPVETFSSTGLVTMTATKTFTDTSKITVTLTQPSAASSTTPVPATSLAIFYQAPYNPTATAWDSTVTAQFQSLITDDTNFTIPYIYLHQDKPTITTKVTSSTGTAPDGSTLKYNWGMKLTGGSYVDRVVNEANTTLSADGWDTNIITRFDQPALSAEKETANGAIVRILIEKGSATLTSTVMYVNYDPVVTIPTGSYSADETAAIKKALNDNVLPYMYLGEAKTVTTKATSAFGNYVELKTNTSQKSAAGKNLYLYNNYHYTKAAVAAFQNDGYDVALEKNYSLTGTAVSTVSQSYFEARKTFSDGAQILVTYTVATTSVTVDAYYYDAFQIPAAGAWSNDTLEAFENNFNGYVLPYIYLGSSKDFITSTSAATSSAGAKMTFTGSTWSDDILTNAADVLDADAEVDWSYINSYSKQYGNTFTATGSFTNAEGDTHHINLNIYKNNNAYARPEMVVEYID